MARQFSRQLGSQPGIQLNPVQDRTQSSVLGVFDQTAALVGRFTRGRIDRPFKVNRSNLYRMLGKPQSVALSGLNEALVHAYEALQRGARELVISRLSVAGSTVSWVTFASGSSSTFGVSLTAPTTGTLGIKHLGCHNDGIKVMVHADAKTVEGAPAANDVVTVKVLDADGAELLVAKGSLNPASVDEFNQSNYLPDVAAAISDLFEWTIIGASIGTTHDGYGKDSSGKDKWATSTLLTAYDEDGTSFLSADYDRSVNALRDCDADFGYIMGGGTRAVALITKLADLAYDTNRQFVFDVPGDFTVSAAITFVQSLGFGTAGRDHYPQVYYAPIKSRDPANGNVTVFGTSGAQVGYRCARNALTNAYGLAPKNQPIAGRNGNLGRANVSRLLSLTEQDLSDLAAAKINVVWWTYFDDGGLWNFTDSLTCAATAQSYRKLVTVAEMSTHIDEAVVRFGRSCLQLPMADAIKRMEAFLERFFGYCLSSGWLIDDGNPEIPPFQYTVQRNAQNPADRMDVAYWLHYDGVARQIFVQQTIV